ncbi:MAG: SpaA isopeptide-forming pilin-related protein [Bifidobacterium sp.]|uniref:SpaA isopeptide-forming pilin-related protein n=3 Tax=Bifidobacterium TaxID=1678 RepID=A0AB39UD00_9BIFI
MKKSSNLAKTGIVKRIVTFLVALATLLVVFQTSSGTALADDTTPGVTTGTINTNLPDDSNGTIIDTAKATFTDANGNEVDSSQVNAGTNVDFKYTWSVPDPLADGTRLKGGDTFTFKMPANIDYHTVTNGKLGDYGTYTVDASGNVTFTFNDNVDGVDDVSGTFEYSSSISQETTTGEQSFDIPTTSNEPAIPYFVQPTGGTDIAKAGTLNGETNGKNPTGITWDVTINTSLQTLTNATVTDPMPSSTEDSVASTLKSVAVYPVTVDTKGNVTSTGAALTEGTDYTVDAAGKVTFIGKYATTRDAFKIEYKSDIDTSKVPKDGGTETFKNTATLNNDGKDSPASASVAANYGKFLDKSFDGADNDGSQKYNWHIDYNGQDATLSADNAVITDTLDKGTFTGTPVLTYADGSTVDPADYTIAYNADHNQMTVSFVNGLDKAVKIAYQSTISGAIDDSDKDGITNTASSDDVTKTTNSGSLGQQGLTKTRGSVDYNTKQVAWHFDINQARQNMSNWILTDTVPEGLTVDMSSFVLKDKDKNVTYVNGTDYEVKATADGFTLEFLGDLKTSAPDWYTLSYNTSFDTLNLPSNKDWKNSAEAQWTDTSGSTHTNTGSADFSPNDSAQNDGSKSGSYNATTKDITWTVVGNYNQRTLSNASITDPIPSTQTYVPDSAKVFEATINADGSYSLGSDVTSSISPSFDSDSKTVTAKLPDDSTKAYVLQFETSLDNQVLSDTKESNTATYTNNKIDNELDASISVPNGSNYVDKSGTADSTDSSYVNWNVWINKSQSTLENAKIVDNPTSNQIVDQSSIKIYPVSVSADGQTYTPDTSKALTLGKDYTVDLQTVAATGVQTLTIAFSNTIHTAYDLQYRTLVNTPLKNDTVSNSVTISADNLEQSQTSKSNNVAVYNNNGSADGKNTTIEINKIDAETKAALSNASFALYSVDSNGQKATLLKTGTTDSDGNLTWGNMVSGKYILVETSAPAGYTISDNLKNGVTFTVSYTTAAASSSPSDVTCSVDTSSNTNKCTVSDQETTGSVVLTKTDGDSNKPLAGAVFDVYSSNDSATPVKSGVTTGADGRVTVDGLLPGDYYFVETAAPAGYELSGDHVPFTIAFQSPVTVATASATNAEKTGSVVLTKTDSDTNKVLAGATFDLYKADGTEVKTGLTTGADGTVTVDGLKPGDYYFVETAAPAGYVLNDSKLNFTVELQTTAKVATASATNAEKTGSVVLTKTDSDTNKVLAGATFDLYKADGTKIQTGVKTGEDGTVTVDGLKPGDYYFVETKAPAGYVKSGAKWVFTVDLQTTAKVANVSVTNDEITGSVVLTKTDGATGKTLAGAVFSLYKADGTKIQSGLKTGADGKVTVDGLKPGDYYFQETQSPKGYRLNAAKLKFTIELQVKSIDATVNAKNDKIPAGAQQSSGESPLAKTGTAIAGVAGVAVVLAFLGLGSVLARSRYSTRKH